MLAAVAMDEPSPIARPSRSVAYFIAQEALRDRIKRNKELVTPERAAQLWKRLLLQGVRDEL
jgi:hypothetical protein